MSMAMMALRICAIEALKSADTEVGSNVLDSCMTAFDQTADGKLSTDQKRPFIAVYTDAAKGEWSQGSGLRGNGWVDILFNFGVSVAHVVTDRETGESVISGLPATDAYFEAIIDVIAAQIPRALTDPENAWAQAFGNLVKGYGAKVQARSSSTADNLRLAAGQLKLTVETYADPAHGQGLGPHWQTFMQLMEDHGVEQLSLFQQVLGQPVTGDERDFERLNGTTTRDAQTLLLYSSTGIPKSVVFSGEAEILEG